MREVGFEPTRPCGQRILNPPCMPIPAILASRADGSRTHTLQILNLLSLPLDYSPSGLVHNILFIVPRFSGVRDGSSVIVFSNFIVLVRRLSRLVPVSVPVGGIQRSVRANAAVKFINIKKRVHCVSLCECARSVPEWIRTTGLPLRRRLLYPLSYRDGAIKPSRAWQQEQPQERCPSCSCCQPCVHDCYRSPSGSWHPR